MPTFNLRREQCEEILDFNVVISEFENQVEQRRLITPFMVLGFKIKSPDLTKSDMQAYRTFFITQYGSLDSFSFVSPFDDQTYTVRFVPDSFRVMYKDGYFKAEFEFKRVPG